MSKYNAKVGEWVTPSETSGSIQNTSSGITIEVTSNAEANEGLTLSPMQIINFDGTIYVRSAGRKDATFTVVPFKIAAGGGGGGGGTPYTLPTASASVKGGIKIGSGLKMTGEVLSLDISSNDLGDWTPNKSYEVNNIVAYGGKLYRCNTAHKSGSAFDISKFESIYADLAKWKPSIHYMEDSVVVYNDKLYMCKISHTSGSTFDSDKFIAIGGSGGDAVLTEAVKANIAAGAIAVNTTIPKDTTFTQFVKKLLVAEIAPTITFTATNSGLIKNGESVTTVLKAVLGSAGTGTFVSVEFLEGSTVIDTQPYVTGTNTYTFAPSNTITTTTTFKARLNYKDSSEAAKTLTKEVKFTFVDPIYHGAVSAAPTTEAEVLAVGNETAADKFGRTITYNLANQKSCYCYPASLGSVSSIKDANNFEYIGSYDKTTVTANSVSYFVYTLKDPVTITGFKQTFA